MDIILEIINWFKWIKRPYPSKRTARCYVLEPLRRKSDGWYFFNNQVQIIWQKNKN